MIPRPHQTCDVLVVFGGAPVFSARTRHRPDE